jgi:uncharacterized protein YegL
VVNLLDFVPFAIEEICMKGLYFSGPQSLLEFLLRPNAKHLKKLEIDNCTFGGSASNSQIFSEAEQFFFQWKVRKV